MRPGADDPSTPAEHASQLQQLQDAQQQAQTAVAHTWITVQTTLQADYQIALASAERQDAWRTSQADHTLALAEASADLAFEQARIAAELIRREALAELQAEYQHARVEIDADFQTARLEAEQAAAQELADLLDTPYTHFLVDEADARLAAWEAVRSTYIALHDPAGTDNLATATADHHAASRDAWSDYATQMAQVQHQQQVTRATQRMLLTQQQAVAREQTTVALAETVRDFQQIREGIGAYSTAQYEFAGLEIETEPDPEGGGAPMLPGDNVVYRETVKAVWRQGDTANSEARLDYVAALGDAHHTQQTALAQAQRDYQAALAAADLAQQQQRDTLLADFTQLQTNAYLAEIDGWESTPATPWHAEAHAKAEAEATQLLAALAARLTRETDTAQARHDYSLAREEARESLQIERASQNAAQALQQQQHLENGDEWIEEEEGHGYWMPADGEGGSTPVDRYANVEINLPIALGQVHSSDPKSADIGHAGNPFDASFNMGNAFGSALAQSGDGEGPLDPYSLANQATSPRGGQFDLDNPLAAAGNTQAQAEQTINNPWGPNNRLLDVNWQGNPSNQHTNTTVPNQVQMAGFFEGQESPSETPLQPEGLEVNLEAGEAIPGITTGPQLPAKDDLPSNAFIPPEMLGLLDAILTGIPNVITFPVSDRIDGTDRIDWLTKWLFGKPTNQGVRSQAFTDLDGALDLLPELNRKAQLLGKEVGEVIDIFQIANRVIVDLIPVIGTTIGAIEALSGKGLFDKKELSNIERAISGIASAISVIPVAHLAKMGKPLLDKLYDLRKSVTDSGKFSDAIKKQLDDAIQHVENALKKNDGGLPNKNTPDLKKAGNGSTVGSPPTGNNPPVPASKGSASQGSKDGVKTGDNVTNGMDAPNSTVRGRRLFDKVTEVGDSTLPAGFGETDKFGNVLYSTLGTADDINLARYHESVHSLLSPKFKLFRELRADIGITAYNKSSFLRYLEEALAESYAQLRVNGLRGLPTGIKFPIKEGYVTIQAVAAEGALGTIVIGGVTYYVFHDAE